MGELGRIKFSLFVMLLLQFAEPRQLLLYHTVRGGDEATLSCENVRTDQSNCDATTWSFQSSRREDEVDLVKLGQKVAERLSLTENCSLVLKEVRAEDAGRYFCKRYKSGTEQKPSAEVYLSVVSITEQRINDEVTLNCSVSTSGRCTRPVKWLLKGQPVDKDNKGIKLSESSCFASVNFLTTYFLFSDSSWSSVFRCEVTDMISNKLFPFRRPPSGDKPVEETTTRPSSADEASSEPGPSALDYVMLSMRVAELVLITVITALLFRTQRNVAPAENKTMRHGAEVNYINVGETSASANKQR